MSLLLILDSDLTVTFLLWVGLLPTSASADVIDVSVAVILSPHLLNGAASKSICGGGGSANNADEDEACASGQPVMVCLAFGWRCLELPDAALPTDPFFLDALLALGGMFTTIDKVGCIIDDRKTNYFSLVMKVKKHIFYKCNKNFFYEK